MSRRSVRTALASVLAVLMLASLAAGQEVPTEPVKIGRVPDKDHGKAWKEAEEADRLLAEFRKSYTWYVHRPGLTLRNIPPDSPRATEDFERVQSAFRKVIETYPGTKVAAYCASNLLGLYSYRRDYDKAIETAEQMAKDYRGTAYEVQAYRSIALMHLQSRHDPAAALPWLEKIPLPEVRHPDSIQKPTVGKDGKRWTQADEARWYQNRAKALSAYEQAVRDHVSVAQLFARCQLELRRPGEAAGRYETLIALFPERKQSFENEVEDLARSVLSGRPTPEVRQALTAWLATYQEKKAEAAEKGWGEEVNGLRCAIEIKPTEIRTGDPFVISVRIRNVSDAPTTVYYQDLYVAQNLLLRNEKGEAVKSQQTAVYNWPHPKTFFRPLKAGETFAAEIKGRAALKFLKAADVPANRSDRPVMLDFRDVACDVDRPGPFTVALRLAADEKKAAQGKQLGFEPVWTGELVSNTLAFSVRPMTREELDRVISTIRFGKSDEKREAIKVVAANADPKAVPVLMGILSGDDRDHTPAAADALVAIQDAGVVADLLSLYRISVRYRPEESGDLQSILLRTIYGLGGNREKRAELALEVLKSDASVEARNTAAWELISQKHPEAASVLIELARKPEPRMQRSAIDALGSMSWRVDAAAKAEVLRAVIDIMRIDPDKTVRRRAASALRNLGDQSAVPALIEALKDPDRSVGFYAANSLGVFAGPEAIPALEAYAESAETEGHKGAALSAIKFIRQRSAAKPNP